MFFRIAGLKILAKFLYGGAKVWHGLLRLQTTWENLGKIFQKIHEGNYNNNSIFCIIAFQNKPY